MKKILVVEDEIAQREIIKELLEMEQDFEVLTSIDGEEALGILEKNKIDLVVLDLNLPVRSGISLLEVLRSDTNKYGNPKIVVYSNYSNEVNKVYVSKFDVDEYLLKLEVEPEKLLSIVKGHLAV